MKRLRCYCLLFNLQNSNIGMKVPGINLWQTATFFLLSTRPHMICYSDDGHWEQCKQNYLTIYWTHFQPTKWFKFYCIVLLYWIPQIILELTFRIWTGLELDYSTFSLFYCILSLFMIRLCFLWLYADQVWVDKMIRYAPGFNPPFGMMDGQQWHN